MTFTYFNAIPNKSTCVGNSLSTIGIALTSLAWNLSSLSAYTVSSINFLQTQINYISANVPTYDYVQTNFVNTSGDTMTGSLSAPTLCASNIYVAASTIHFFNPVTKQVVGTFGNLDNTNYRRTYATVSSTSANWGGGPEFSNIAYVHAISGNNTTGNGTPNRPWATLQKAVNEGFNVVYIGPGNVGDLNLTANLLLSIKGEGYFISEIGNIQYGGFNLTLLDIGHKSFRVEATAGIYGTGPSGSSSGNLEINGLYSPLTNIIAQGGDSFSIGAQGGGCGSVILTDCHFAEVNANGGTGGPGDESNTSGPGGDGGLIYLTRTTVNSIANFGGGPGSDGGAGSGALGTDGGFNAKWSEWSTLGSGIPGTVIANVIAGVFTP